MSKKGENVAEATIIKMVKKEGEKINADEAVLEIATDKVDSEVPSSVEGFLEKRLFKEGDVVQVGAVIAIISTDKSGSGTPVPEKSAAVAAEPVSSKSAPVTAQRQE